MVQLKQAEYRKRLHKAKWDHEIAKRKAWRAECERKQAEVDAATPASFSGVGTLKRMIRQMAGVNPRIEVGRECRSAVRPEDITSGVQRLYSVGPNAWENAVRALEEG